MAEVLTGAATPTVRPKRLTRGELAKVGVELNDPASRADYLTCTACGQSWGPRLQTGGRMPRGYWHCPNGCNRPHGE